MFRLENVDFSYEKGEKVLKNINLDIEKGKKIVFLGENGSGKSTLFLIMNGLLKIDSGNIFLEGRKITYSRKMLSELRKKVGIVFQDPEIQIFAPTVYQEMAYGLQNLNFSEEETEKRIMEISKELGIEKLLEKPCHHLSYGQKKRITLASIIVMEPEIMILDEPTAWLDTRNTEKIMEILNYLHEKNRTLIISTHDIDFAYRIADYIFVLSNGEIVEKGTRDEIFHDFGFLRKMKLNMPEILKIKYFLESRGIDMKEYEDFCNREEKL